jgi:Predicted DNA modification methylase
MYIAVLGRQPAIGLAELESKFGSENVSIVSSDIAKIDCNEFDISRFGSIKKAGKVIIEFSSGSTSENSKIVFDTLANQIDAIEGKVTIGLSSYTNVFGARDLQQIGLKLKSHSKKRGYGLRLVPNEKSELSTATSHHNRLGLSPNKIEVLIATTTDNRVVIATSVGSQNISAYANRDQNRPARDMFVGMLPPKLAQTIVNMAVGQTECNAVLDPFCGTGVLLQEALLMKYGVIGTDLSEKMISYSKTNMEWLEDKLRRSLSYQLSVGDATTYKWDCQFDVVACEAYLGQPFSAPPSPAKLIEVQQTCKGVISSFLSNVSKQIKPGTRICIAIPAWRRVNGSFSRLNLLDSLPRLGYNLVEFKHASQSDLLYHRDNQIVGRELLVLVRSK